METLCAIVRGDLAPAGNKILMQQPHNAAAYQHQNHQSQSYQLQGYQAVWLDSGTSALALALADAKAKAPQVNNPKVIIPGYCCPDLVAAAVYAGVKPLAVDIAGNDAGYDLNALSGAIDSDVIAIIAVNFLGIKERLADIRFMLVNTNIKLIEDNAQWFPASLAEHDFSSDYILFSFGRGKPLSLLGGGVLFAKEHLVVTDWVKKSVSSRVDRTKQRLKLLAYNLLLRPKFYCYLNRAPFLSLGETRYHALAAIVAMDSFRSALFAANLIAHAARNKNTEQAYDDILAEKNQQSLTSLHTARRQRLLRYPVLCRDCVSRDVFLRQLNAQGLGGSPMYPKTIVEIPGVADLIDVHATLENAKKFAQCFLTLPTHEFVTAKHIDKIKPILTAQQL